MSRYFCRIFEFIYRHALSVANFCYRLIRLKKCHHYWQYYVGYLVLNSSRKPLKRNIRKCVFCGSVEYLLPEKYIWKKVSIKSMDVKTYMEIIGKDILKNLFG